MALCGGDLTDAVSACADGWGGASHASPGVDGGRGVAILATEPGLAMLSSSMATGSSPFGETTGDTAALLRLGCSAGGVLT